MPHEIVCGHCDFIIDAKPFSMARPRGYQTKEDKKSSILICPKCGTKLSLDVFDLEVTELTKKEQYLLSSR